MRKLAIFLILIASVPVARAAIRLPQILSSNMVIQRDQPVKIWGWADKGEKVTLLFNGQKASARAAQDGTWSVQFEPMEAGGPYDLIIKGDNEIVLENILVGDVWICSGQSNMEFEVYKLLDAEQEIANANYPDIRLFNVPQNVQFSPAEDIPEESWHVCSPESVGDFSAVGYFFGRTLYREIGVPIGLIGSNWGGTRVETWMSKETMHTDNELYNEFIELEGVDEEAMQKKDAEVSKAVRQKYGPTGSGIVNGKPVWADPGLDVSDWNIMELPCLWEDSELPGVDGVVWFRKDVELKGPEVDKEIILMLGPIDDSDQTWIKGRLVGETIQKYNDPRIYKIPPGELKEGLNSIVVRVDDTGGGGGIWGDPSEMKLVTQDRTIDLSGPWQFRVSEEGFRQVSTIFNPNRYPSLLYNGMIHPIIRFAARGVIWYQGEANVDQAESYGVRFPAMIEDWRRAWNNPDLGFYFVQLANFMAPDDQPSESNWAELREAQMKALSLPETGMAVIIDIGEADDIHPKNKQDVGYRLALPALHFTYHKDLEYSGPIFKSLSVSGDTVLLEFDHIGNGLIADDRYGYLKGFALAGKDGVFRWAKAWIDGNRVAVCSDEVHDPIKVRYGWGNNPDDVNLYNSEGLPASPFRALVE